VIDILSVEGNLMPMRKVTKSEWRAERRVVMVFRPTTVPNLRWFSFIYRADTHEFASDGDGLSRQKS
jgi:hypothetical protein